MKASLLIIGDEILSGDTLDTNSNFAAQVLNENGIPLFQKLTVGDRLPEIKAGLDFLLKEADLVISCGGLGPTKDDVTKTAFAEYFGSEIVLSEEVLRSLEDRYTRMGRPLNKLNQTQAMVPAKAEVIINPVGTAPVFWFEKDGKAVATLPGVPQEMRYLMEHVIRPKIKSRFIKEAIVHRYLQVIGLPESTLAEKLASVDESIEKTNSEEIRYKLAYLPQLMQVKLRLTGIGTKEKEISTQLDEWKQEIKSLVGEYIYAEDISSLPAAIGDILKPQSATLATAESCTGGYLAYLITSVSGSSAYYQGSVISYDNEVKKKELNVRPETLEAHGAVSEATCREMVEGALAKFGTTYALATTGIAGPNGGSPEKPVGTVWLGVGGKDGIHTRKFVFNRSRQDNIHMFAMMALDMLRRYAQGMPILRQ